MTVVCAPRNTCQDRITRNRRLRSRFRRLRTRLLLGDQSIEGLLDQGHKSRRSGDQNQLRVRRRPDGISLVGDVERRKRRSKSLKRHRARNKQSTLQLAGGGDVQYLAVEVPLEIIE